jgi:proton-dependent oligopeptide transporter, POT family
MAVENLFFIALLFLILGNGAFKPNISTQVGDLYPPSDPRRDLVQVYRCCVSRRYCNR